MTDQNCQYFARLASHRIIPLTCNGTTVNITLSKDEKVLLLHTTVHPEKRLVQKLPLRGVVRCEISSHVILLFALVPSIASLPHFDRISLQ